MKYLLLCLVVLLKDLTSGQPPRTKREADSEPLEIGTSNPVVVAIDFGTTYSGYSFPFKKNPPHLHTSKKWTLDITEGTLLSDIEGKQFPAVEIFAHAIRYLKEHFQRALVTQTGDIYSETQIQYVLTVPAIWDDRAKIFMRRAALTAGIPGKQLLLALEAEVASLWCRALAEDSQGDIGKKHIVADLGGGKVDIAVHEETKDGTLKELHQAVGDDSGSTAVEDNFVNMLTMVYGWDVFNQLKTQRFIDYINIHRSFETKMCSLTSVGGLAVNITHTLWKIFEETGRDFNKSLSDAGLIGKILAVEEKLIIDASLIREWFKGPMDKLIRHLNTLIEQDGIGGVDTILLVGGFAESPIVPETISEAFPNKTVIVPDDAGLAVLKGAVMYGLYPWLIAARKSKFAYGIETTTESNPLQHSESLCCGIFVELVAIGEDLEYGTKIQLEGGAVDVAQTNRIITLYASNHAGTKFVDEEGCAKIGDINKPHAGGIRITYVSFWDTEIKYRVEVMESGKEDENVFDQL